MNIGYCTSKAYLPYYTVKRYKPIPLKGSKEILIKGEVYEFIACGLCIGSNKIYTDLGVVTIVLNSWKYSNEKLSEFLLNNGNWSCLVKYLGKNKVKLLTESKLFLKN